MRFAGSKTLIKSSDDRGRFQIVARSACPRRRARGQFQIAERSACTRRRAGSERSTNPRRRPHKARRANAQRANALRLVATKPLATEHTPTTTDAIIIGFLNTPLFDVAVVLPHVSYVSIVQDIGLPLMSLEHIEGTGALGLGLSLLSRALEYVNDL